MSGIFDTTEIEIPCENCCRKIKKSIGWIKSHRQLTCGCGATIILDTNQFKTEIAKVERSLADLKRALK
ncbi:MAG: hypothetical protein VBE63_18340 [Lamprobacter sp.]|uniref:hypothetical protein n=1 Tax=Lamprobacter sp. TaxID=3100796 RepID=UPI002B25A75A|nr:hypothetical protein [Lamprobacter sp.]MEA3641875.1 hypothetical protein [Lamprobacter sp.]